MAKDQRLECKKEIIFMVVSWPVPISKEKFSNLYNSQLVKVVWPFKDATIPFTNWPFKIFSSFHDMICIALALASYKTYKTKYMNFMIKQTYSNMMYDTQMLL